MRILRQTIFLFAILLVSCSPGGRKEVETLRLTPVSVVDSSSLYGAYGLYYADRDHLLFQYSKNVFFRSWNISQSRMDGSFFRQGRGPLEFGSVGTPRVRRTPQGTVLLDMITSSSFISVDWKAAAAGQEGCIVESLNISELLEDGELMSSPFVVGEGRLLCGVANDKEVYSFKLIDSGDGTVVKTYPVAELFKDADVLKVNFSNCHVLRPERDKLALLMYHFGRIIILDLEGEKPLCVEVDFGKGACYYYGTCSNRYIYALYGSPGEHKKIHLLDWDGNLIRILDQDHELMDIAVSEDDSLLYALTADNLLLTFDLPNS